MGRKHYISIAKELVFGTAPVNGWHGMVVEDLGGHNPVIVNQQNQGMVFKQQGPPVSGRRTSVRGAGGSLKPMLEFGGLAQLLLLECTFGAPVVTELVEDEAWEYKFETGTTPDDSIATQTGREFADGTQDRDTWVGGQVEKFTLSQGMAPSSSGVTDEGLLKAEWGMNYRTMVAHPEKLPVYSGELPYSGSDWTHSMGVDLDHLFEDCLDSWGLEWSTNLDFEGARCASKTNRDKAGPGGFATGKITGAAKYKNRQLYDAWINGDVLALRSEWKPEGIFLDAGNTVNPSFTIDVPAFGMEPDPSPKESKDAATKQDLPRQIMWDDVNDLPMMTVTVVSGDAPPA